MSEQTTAEMIDLRDRAAAAYYESGEPILSDDAFDELTSELAGRGVPEQVGHGAAGGKVAHLRPMLSLRKVHRVEDLEELLSGHPGAAFTVEPKFDGLAVSVRFDQSGRVHLAVTRGDGEKGDDITPAAKAIFERQGIPTRLNGGAGEVRGEIVMLRSALERLNVERRAADEKEFANPRNAAAGMIAKVARGLEGLRTEPAGTSNHSKRQQAHAAAVAEAGRWLTFLAYDAEGYGFTDKALGTGLLGGRLSVASEVSPFLRYLLPQSAHGLSPAGVHAAVTWLELHADELDVDTDGVVLKFSDPALRECLGASSTAPRWALAYKFPNRPKQTILRAVEWAETRTGRVVPTAVFDPVELAGATVSRATLNNVSFLEELDVWIGDTIEVTRANEVIPNVVRRVGEHAADAVPVRLPDGYRREGRDLVHDSGRDPVKDISFAAQALDVLGLGEDVVRRLLEANPDITTFPELLDRCCDNALNQFERGTQKLVTKIENEVISKTSGPQDPAKWVKAVGLPGVGYRAGKRLSSLIVELHDGNEPSHTQSPFELLHTMVGADELRAVPGFGESMVGAILSGVETFSQWDRSLGNIEWDWAKYRAQSADSPLSGKRVLVTGTLPSLSRKDAEARIEALGGTVASSVSGALDVLIAGEKAGSKLAKAQGLGITIMDGATFEGLN